MDQGYGGHPPPYAPAPQQQHQFPHHPLHFPPQGGGAGGGGGGGGPPPSSFFPPPPPPPAPMAAFSPYGPSLGGAGPGPGPGPGPYASSPFPQIPQHQIPPHQIPQHQIPHQIPHPLPHPVPLPHPHPHPMQGFFNPWDPPPPVSTPPPDPELQKRIDKLVEYSAKNGPEFEKMLREKQKENPLYAFLFGAEGFNYYRYKLWITVNPHLANPYSMSAAPNPVPFNINPNLAPTQGVLPQYYDNQQQQQQQLLHQPYFDPSYNQEAPPMLFKGLSGPLPGDVAMELQSVLDNLTGTKESIKGAKNWFMQRLPFAPALAEALRERVLSLDDDVRQLHIIFLANDILFDSLQRRTNFKELDNEALAFQPVLGSMLAAIYHNPQNKETNQMRLQKIVQFWGAKEVYSKEIISAFENEMIAGPPTGYRMPALHARGPQMEKSLHLSANIPGAIHTEPTGIKEHAHILTPDHSQTFHSPSRKEENPLIAALAAAQYAQTSGPVSALNTPFVSSLTNLSQLSTSGKTTDQSPYPLFPPGLIPGMVRKMQIGTGVPYSALSPLDIPAVIPPSTVSDSYVLDRVAKFFKDIGEVDPLEGKVKRSRSHDDDDDEMEERERSRIGGNCIPPPSSLIVDPETNTLPDGSIEHKPGSINSGRLGLGAVADPNEITQYDDVYTSYRKQRSTSYHSFMSARAAAR